MTCIITGCAAIDEERGLYVWGDLFQIAGSYILKSLAGKDGKTQWRSKEELVARPGIKAMVMDAHCRYFEAPGIIVAPSFGFGGAILNGPARDYLSKTGPGHDHHY